MNRSIGTVVDFRTVVQYSRCVERLDTVRTILRKYTLYIWNQCSYSQQYITYHTGKFTGTVVQYLTYKYRTYRILMTYGI